MAIIDEYSEHSTGDMESSQGYGTPIGIAEEEVNEVKKLTRKENKNVWIWKFLVVVTIMATASVVSVGSYILLRNEETDAFKTSVSKIELGGRFS